jgi:hypothetical protein
MTYNVQWHNFYKQKEPYFFHLMSQECTPYYSNANETQCEFNKIVQSVIYEKNNGYVTEAYLDSNAIAISQLMNSV